MLVNVEVAIAINHKHDVYETSVSCVKYIKYDNSKVKIEATLLSKRSIIINGTHNSYQTINAVVLFLSFH
jgi:hypothetical protein